MPCGLSGRGGDVDLDIRQHWSTLPGARMEKAGLRADCPGCGAHRGLSVQDKGGYYPAWNLHCDPTCDRDAVRAKLAALLPGCVSVRYSPRHAIDRDDLISLADSSMPPQSLRLAMYELAGIGTQAALDRMGVRREHRSRVITGRRAPKRVQTRR